jgi:hypothetical protein
MTTKQKIEILIFEYTRNQKFYSETIDKLKDQRRKIRRGLRDLATNIQNQELKKTNLNEELYKNTTELSRLNGLNQGLNMALLDFNKLIKIV